MGGKGLHIRKESSGEGVRGEKDRSEGKFVDRYGGEEKDDRVR